MDTNELGAEKVKKEVDNNDFNEDFQTDIVKHEPCKINIFNKCEMYDEGSSEDFVDKPDYIDQSDVCEDISTNECTEQIKTENDFDIFNEDIKREIVQETFLKLCKLCSNSFSSETGFIGSRNNKFECSCHKQDKEVTLDVKLPTLRMISGSGLQQLIAQDKTVSEDGCSEKQVSTSAPQRDSVPLFKNNKMTASNTTDDIPFSEHQMTDTLETNSLYNARNSKNNESIQSGGKPFHCKVCSKSFSKKSYLTAHMRVHTGEKPFHCKFCSKSFTRSGDLNVHLKLHTGEKPFHCKVCFKSFIKKSYLNAHMNIHTGEKSFHCKICSKSFVYAKNLKAHMKIHTGEKPFHCKICLKSFIRAADLKGHLKIHTRENQFHCKVCPKSFVSESYFNTHLKVHSGENSFNCKVCSKSCFSSSQLKTHEKIHTRENSFYCKVCSKSCFSSSQLKTHEKIHTRENSFYCKFCSKSFVGESFFNTHLRMHAEEK